MPIQFKCHSCGLTLSVKDEFAGRACKCKCGVALTVPGASGQASTPAVGTSPLANPTQNRATNQNPAVQNQAPQQQRTQPQTRPQTQPQSQQPRAVIPAQQRTGNQQHQQVAPLQQAGRPQQHAPVMPNPAMQQMPFGKQEAPEYYETVSKSLSVESVQCAECGKNYTLKPEYYGRVVQCQCGAPVRMDHPLGYVPPQHMFAKNKQQQVAVSKNRSDDQILDQYMDKESVQESNENHGYNDGAEGAFSFEEGILKGSIFGGIGCMIVGAIWLILGWQNEVLFWYPVVLLIIGFIGTIVGITRAIFKI